MEIREYWPGYLQEIAEFRALAEAEQPEMDAVTQALRSAPNEFFTPTLSQYGAGRWEKIMGLPVAHSGNLEDRRFRVMARFAEQLPYTRRRLEQLMGSLCGEDGYSLDFLSGYALKVRVALTAKQNYADVGVLLGRVIPMNVTIDLSLKYNQHQALDGFTHAQLVAYTYDQLRNEVIS